MRLLLAGLLLASVPTHAADHVVTQAGKKFSASTLAVRAGEKVTFRNDDAIAHNVFSTSAAKAFNLQVQQPKSESTVTFERAGEVQVRCAFHPTMKLTVQVQ